MEQTTTWGMIDARSIVFPARTHELNALTLVFLTPAELVRAWVPGEDLELVVLPGGTVQVLLALHEYRSGDWGACNTCDLCVPVRPVGAVEDDGRDGLHLRGPLTNHRFNGEIAYWSMGIARRHAAIDMAHRREGLSIIVAEGGAVSLEVAVAGAAPATSRSFVATRCYSYLEGRPLVAPFDVEFPDPAVDPDTVRIDLGTGRLARDLAALGLPRRPDAVAWGTGLSCTFHAPHGLGG